MAHIHKDQLTASKEWARHLRPWGKRDFWKRERKEGRHEGFARLNDWAT